MCFWNSEERSMLEPQKKEPSEYRCSFEAQRVHDITHLVQAQEQGPGDSQRKNPQRLRNDQKNRRKTG